MLFLHFCKALFQILQSLLFTFPAKHTVQKLNFTYPATPLFTPLQTPFYLFCNTFFLHTLQQLLFLHILWKSPLKLLTTDAAEIYLSCKYERQSHFAQYVNIRIWPKLSAVHHNPIWVELRRMPIQTNFR